MFSIIGLKRKSRSVLKRTYFGVVLSSLLITITLGTFQNPINIIENTIMPFFESSEIADNEVIKETTSRLKASNTSDILNEFLENIGAGNTTSQHWTAGVLSVFASATEVSGNLIIGILNVINHFAFGDKISSGIVILAGIVVSAAVYVLIIDVLLVGFYRFLLESRRYSKTQPSRMLFPWSIKKGLHTSWVMLVRRVFTVLWYLTVAGGFIKHYSYKMVPLILAENPDMSAREAIDLSRKMMYGNKWKAFLLDLSFAGWIALGFITMSLSNILYTNPYRYATEAELYMTLREKAKADKIPSSEKLCDDLLTAEPQKGVYPAQDYIITPPPGRKWITSDYKRDYSVTSLILMFFSFSFIGWVWEVVVFMFTEGEFINRGTSYGPWLPIYGFGGLVILVTLKKFRDNPALLFVVTAVVCGIMEYCTAWLLESFTGMKYWNYSGYFLNIQGRVCLEGLLVFAIAGLAATYLIGPALDDLFKRIPQKWKNIICAVLITAFIADLSVTFFIPHTGKGITEYDN